MTVLYIASWPVACYPASAHSDCLCVGHEPKNESVSVLWHTIYGVFDCSHRLRTQVGRSCYHATMQQKGGLPSHHMTQGNTLCASGPTQHAGLGETDW